MVLWRRFNRNVSGQRILCGANKDMLTALVGEVG
jgi:hypothetical protein